MKKLLQSLLMVLFLLLPINLFANETITLAIGDWPPYTSEKNMNAKIAEAIVSEVFKLENIDVIYRYHPWKRSYKMVKYGKYVGTFPWSYKKYREGEVIFCKEPLFKSKTVFFHLKSLDFKWETFDDLKKYKIGGVLGFSSVNLLDSKGIKLQLVTKETLNFKKLLIKRIDICPTTFMVGYATINDLYKPDKAALFTNNPKPLSEENMFLLISKKIPNGQQIADSFDIGLKKLKDSGKYDEIISKFL